MEYLIVNSGIVVDVRSCRASRVERCEAAISTILSRRFPDDELGKSLHLLRVSKLFERYHLAKGEAQKAAVWAGMQGMYREHVIESLG